MNQPVLRAGAQIIIKKKFVWGWEGGTQWLGLCFGNVNEAGNFLSVPFLRVNQRAAPCMCGRFVLGMPAEQRSAGRFED